MVHRPKFILISAVHYNLGPPSTVKKNGYILLVHSAPELYPDVVLLLC
jgi:hypothetical protein